MSIQSYRDLRVWQLAMDPAAASYKATARFPADERYGLTTQIRRAAASVPANIAEGYGRESKGAYIQQLRVAQGPLKELETHLILAARVGIANEPEMQPLTSKADDIGRMLRSLIRSVEASE